MKKINTLSQLTDALGKKANVKAWEKGGKQRLYFNGLGYNTKMMETKAWIELRDGRAEAIVSIYCPSQPSSWIENQQKEVKVQMEKYVRYIHRFFDFGVTGEPIEVVMNNALLAAEPIRGYYTEWREVRVAINRFGKLADRNRQFVVPFEGSKESAPRGFVPLSDKAFEYLKRAGEQMLEPYAAVPDYNERADLFQTYQEEKEKLAQKEVANKLVAEQEKARIAEEGKAKMEQLVASGMNVLAAWKIGGCQHPAPAEVYEAKKTSGLNWNKFIATIQ